MMGLIVSVPSAFCVSEFRFFFLVLADRSDVFFPVWSSGVAIFQSSWVQLIEPSYKTRQEYFGGLLPAYLFIYLFIYNNFICNNQYKKAAIREELNPHVR